MCTHIQLAYTHHTLYISVSPHNVVFLQHWIIMFNPVDSPESLSGFRNHWPQSILMELGPSIYGRFAPIYRFQTVILTVDLQGATEYNFVPSAT